MRFTAYTVVPRDFEAHHFGPGDEVPSWAVDLVGEHVTDAGQRVEPKPEKPEPEPKQAETEPVKTTEQSAEPDFTKPAPRRGRPPKNG